MKKVPLAYKALDVAVFSLSLMGKNWHEYNAEAKRCLVTNGILIIAETTKSLKGRLSNIRDEIQKRGFDIYSDDERGDFTFIEARELLGYTNLIFYNCSNIYYSEPLFLIMSFLHPL